MLTITDPKEVQRHCLGLRARGRSIALVPTMGFFHEGHLSLMRRAKALGDTLVVSLFVNPTQFGPGEDLDAYPSKLREDAELAEREGTDLLFCPQREDMYHPDHSTWVDVHDLGTGLCGRSRPTHFRGVTTIVGKLFNLVQPTHAVFGEKDWQQLAIIRRMVRDLDFPVTIVGSPIVREPDGLAMSSRNSYLLPGERTQAPALQAGLQLARNLVRKGTADVEELTARVREFYADNLPLGRIDYLEVVDPDSLRPLARIEDGGLIAVAMHLGRARLIDNLRI
jgi:pantoate--beta-alanine ligase